MSLETIYHPSLQLGMIQLTKHIDIRLKFCGEVVAAGKLRIEYVKTANNIADIFTKPLPAPRFRELRKEIVVDLLFILQAGSSTTTVMLATLDNFKNPSKRL